MPEAEVQERKPATRATTLFAVRYSRLHISHDQGEHTQSSRVLTQTVVQLDLQGVGMR